MYHYPAEQEQQTDQAIEEQNQWADQADPGVLTPEPTQTSYAAAIIKDSKHVF